MNPLTPTQQIVLKRICVAGVTMEQAIELVQRATNDDKSHTADELYEVVIKLAFDDNTSGTYGKNTDTPELGPANKPEDNQGNANGECHRPGISDEFLKKHNIRHVDESEAEELIGRRQSGLAIPYRSLTEPKLLVNGRHFHRIRLDQATDQMKYLSPTGGGAQLYIPLDINFTSDLAITESEFKDLSIFEEGIPAVAIGGICSMMPKGRLLPELAAILTKYHVKKIRFVGDADTALIFDFAREATKLANLLGNSIVVELPRFPIDGPNGVDDLRHAVGAGSAFMSRWEEALSNSIIVKPKTDPSILAAELIIRELERIAASTDKARYLEKIAILGSKIKAPLSRQQLAKAVRDVLGVAIPAFKQAIKMVADKRREDARAQAENEKKTADPLYTELSAKYGPPFSEEGEVNQSYFVHRFAREHHVLYEQDERAFFQYETQTGAWRKVDKDVIKELIRLDWERLVPQEFQSLANDALLNALVSGVRSFLGKIKVFKPLRRGLLHTRNCMLQLHSDGRCEQLEFHPDYFSRNPLAFNFNPAAKAPRFLQMVTYPLDQDDASLLIRIIGSCILGGNPAQRFAIFYGEPKSAKSMLANIISAIIGLDNTGELRTAHLEERFEIGLMVGKTLLTARDVAGNFLQARGAHVLKRLVGGDNNKGEVKGSMTLLDVPGDFSVLITCNETLLVWLRGDTDTEAWRRRMIIIKFLRSVAPKDRINKIDELILREEGEGVLLLAIQGAIAHLHELEKCGGDFVLTETQEARVDKLLSESQGPRIFVRDRVVPDPDKDVTTEELISAYAEFCKSKGWKPQPSKIIEKQMPDLMAEIHSVRLRHDILRDGKAARGYSQVTLV